MKIVTVSNPFDSTKTVSMAARYESTRNGFRHVAETTDGAYAKCCYLNRTWERYTYESVLHLLAEKWIAMATGWKPNTKRDKAKFEEAYRKMVADIDSNRNWI